MAESRSRATAPKQVSVEIDGATGAEESKARTVEGAGVGVGVLAASGSGAGAAADDDGSVPKFQQMVIVEEMPKNIKNTSRCIKFTYLVLYSLLFWLLHSLPSTLLWNKDGSANGEYMFLLVFMALVSYISICVVQGSNPGYMATAGEGNGTAKKAIATVEMSSLLQADAAQDNHDPEEGRTPIPISDGLIPQRHRAASASALEMPPPVRAGESKSAGNNLPLRSKFCRSCQLHVATYDHHCGMIGTCIGERNHCKFWWMLLCTTACIIMCIAVVDNSYTYQRYWWDWIKANELSFLASIIFYGSLVFIGFMLLFHTWLACSSLTTYEMGKGADRLPYLAGTKDFDLPFSKGIVWNLNSFCCMRDGVWGILGRNWRPIQWKPPGRIERDSDDVFENCWENKYWSCC